MIDDIPRIATAAALRPGGRIALEMNHYLRLLRDYLPSVMVERDGDLVIDQHQLDPPAGRSLSTRTYLRGGRSRRVLYSVRMFGFPELRDWLRAVGFTAVDGYGEDGQPLAAESRRMIAVGRM